MKTNKLAAAGIMITCVLAGCGGGGSTAASVVPAAVTPVITASAEGVYEGTISNGRSHTTLVLENDQFFTLYGSTIAGGGLAVSGFIQGTGKSNNGSFSSTDLKDFFADGTAIGGSLSATYSPKASLNGSVTEGTSSVTFTGTSPLKNSSYAYDVSANVADIAGVWSLVDLQGSAVILNVSSSGSFAGSASGCSFVGDLKPRASGKNVFDVALTFGPSPCRLAGQAATGIAVDYLSGTKRQLLLAGTNSARTSGMAFLGQR